MILPIYAYGQPVLKKIAEPLTHDYPELSNLIGSMWETMYNAEGVGLAAPQIGLPIRLFIVDTHLKEEGEKKEEPRQTPIRKIFINAQMIEESGALWTFEEGCLSIPDIRGDVERHEKIRIRYLDENFQEFEEEFDGLNARVIQHEYDHIQGILFIEKLKPLKKQLIRRKLEKIRNGEIKTDYKMKFIRR